MADLKSTIDLARKQAKKGTLKVTPSESRDPLGTSALAGKTVTKTGFAERMKQQKESETARISRKRQECISKGGTFDPVTERCSTGITEDLQENISVRTSEQERAQMQEEGKIKTERELAEKGDISALISMKSKEGFDSEQERKDFEALISGLEKKKEEEAKTSFEERIAQQRLKEKEAAQEKAVKAAAPGITRGVSDLGFARGVQGLISKEADLLRTQTAEKRVEIEETAQKIRDSLAEGRADLAAVYQKQYSALRQDEINLLKQKTSSIIDAIGGDLSGMTDEELITLSDETGADLTTLELTRNRLQTEGLAEEQKTQLATQKTAQGFVKGLNNDQLGALTSEQAVQLNKEAGLPEGTIQSWMIRAQEINKLSDEEQRLANEELQKEIDLTSAKVNTEAAKTADEVVGGFTSGNEVVIGKGQNNPYLGKEGGSLTFRTNNPGAITAPAGNLAEADRLAKKHGAIPGLYSQDALGKLVLNFRSEEDGFKAMTQLLDEYGDISIGKVFETWSGTDANGYKKLAKEQGIDINQNMSELLPDEKLKISEIINKVEAGPDAVGKDVEPSKSITKETLKQGFDERLKDLYTKEKITGTDLDIIKGLGVSIDDFYTQKNNFVKFTKKNLTDNAKKLVNLLEDLKGQGLAVRGIAATPIIGEIPGTAARDLRKKFDGIKSNVALQELVSLKEAGATFGALSNQELGFITDSASILDLGASQEQWEEEIDRILNLLKKGTDTEGEQEVSNNFRSKYNYGTDGNAFRKKYNY